NTTVVRPCARRHRVQPEASVASAPRSTALIGGPASRRPAPPWRPSVAGPALSGASRDVLRTPPKPPSMVTVIVPPTLCLADVHAGDPLADAGQHLVGDRPLVLGQLVGRHARPQQLHLVTFFDGKRAAVKEDLVHGHRAGDGYPLPSDDGVSLVGQKTRVPVGVPHGNGGH